MSDCDEGLKLDPVNIKALFRRAQGYKMLENYDESYHDLTSLLKKDPKNPAARRELLVVMKYRDQVQLFISPFFSYERPSLLFAHTHCFIWYWRLKHGCMRRVNRYLKAFLVKVLQQWSTLIVEVLNLTADNVLAPPNITLFDTDKSDVI